MLKKREHREVLAAVEELAADHGVEVSVPRTKRHVQVALSFKGRKRQMSLSTTPRTDIKNNINFAKQQARRLMRQLGVPC